MGKNKLFKFAEMETFPHVFQCTYNDIQSGNGLNMKGLWNREVFHNNNPIILELGCGKGEYTIGLAERFPDKNYIGVDIKGARIWKGAKESFQRNMKNVAFLRTNIDILDYFFNPGEVSEIWITFPDPQMKKTRKRLTSATFLRKYSHLLGNDGLVHLNTDSYFMYTYTKAIVELNHFPVEIATTDLYSEMKDNEILSIKTFYEQQWLSRGISIKYLKFRLLPTDQIKEPNIEIEHDTYRSFGRNRGPQT